MAISPLKSERIAFEHPCFLVAPVFMRRDRDRKCIDRRTACKKRNSTLAALSGMFALALSACPPVAQVPAQAPAPMITGGW